MLRALRGHHRILAACVAAVACGAPTEPERSAPFSGWLDGRPFAARVNAFLVVGDAGTDTLRLHTLEPADPVHREVSLSLEIPGFTGPGRYRLGAYHASVFETVGGDVLQCVYRVAGTGVVVIDGYDRASGALSGGVEFTAAREPECTAGVFGANVRLTAGRFRATVQVAR